MNADTGQIYHEETAIDAARERGEPLLYGKLEVLEDVQPLLMNRAQRRLRARIRPGERKGR